MMAEKKVITETDRLILRRYCKEDLQDLYEYYINTVDEDEYGGKFTSEILIDPETICQYTGLKDKNGKKIFEGDILSAYLDSEIDEKTYAQVTWNGFSWCIRERSRDDVMTEWDCKHFEVCGNIFDNPEFKEGGK